MQNKVSEFNSKRNCHLKPMPVAGRILDIESELGELGKEYLKCSPNTKRRTPQRGVLLF
jgi:hypothetical protein